MQPKTWSFAVVLLALSGCAPSNPGIEIEGLLSPTDACTYTTSTTAVFLGQPLLDTTLDPMRVGGIRYTAALQLVNRMLNLSNSVYPLTTDTNSFHVREAEVELRGLDGAPLAVGDLPARFRVPASGFIPSATSDTESGRGVAFVDVVPSVYGEALAGSEGTILVAVTLTGTTSGDSTQTTGELQFPLQLCTGCLFQCAVTEDGEPIPEPVSSCAPGQDSLSLIPCPTAP
ncbi:MAG: hypothetical protein M3Y87_32865 [Myxococcota bacterium]|nr:hypothetical protein [Myxococcota bacterium]